MTGSQRARIEKTVQHVVGLLVLNRFTEIESMSNGVRLTADEMRSEIRLYGRSLVSPPPEAYAKIDIVPIAAAETRFPEFSIRFRLYTEEEGRSDLELQATLVDDGKDEIMGLEMDGILVA